MLVKTPRDHSIVINRNGQHPFSCRSTSAVVALQMFFSAPYCGTLAIIDFHRFSLQKSTWDFAGRSLFGSLCYCAGRMHNYSYSIIPGCLFFFLGCMSFMLLPIWTGALKVQGTGFVTSK